MRAAALTRYLALAHGLWSAAFMDLLRAWTRRKSDDSESKHARPARKRKGTRALLVGMFGRPPGLLHRGQRFWPSRPLCLSDVMHSRLLGSFSSQRPANKESGRQGLADGYRRRRQSGRRSRRAEARWCGEVCASAGPLDLETARSSECHEEVETESKERKEGETLPHVEP